MAAAKKRTRKPKPPPPVRNPLEMALNAATEAEVLAAVSQAAWIQSGREGNCPEGRTATVEELAQWLYSGVDAEAIHNAQTACSGLLGKLFEDAESVEAWNWVGVEVSGSRKGREQPRVRLMLTGQRRSGVPAVVEDGVMRAHRNWVESKNAGQDFRHPIAPLVRTWQQRRRKAAPEERRRGIVPVAFTALMPHAAVHRAGQLTPPEQPGPVGLTPEEQVSLPALRNADYEGKGDTPSLLLGLFDRDFNELDSGRSPTAPVSVRVLVEVILATPAAARDGWLHEVGPFPVRNIAQHWLRWKTRNYRVGGEKTGLALKRGVHALHNIVIPYGRSGGYYPVRLDHFSSWGLAGDLFFDVRLPEGSGVGPPVDREVLRVLGVKSARAYRAYLWLIFQWDRFGGHHGRLITPTRTMVRRNAEGHLLDRQGRVVTDQKGRPVESVHDPRAVVLAGREVNPASERYPQYEGEDLVEMIYSPSAVMELRTSRNRWRQAMVRARRSIEMIEAAGGCVIRRSGHQLGKRDEKTPGFPWRIMPPDHFANNEIRDNPRTGRSRQEELIFY